MSKKEKSDSSGENGVARCEGVPLVSRGPSMPNARQAMNAEVTAGSAAPAPAGPEAYTGDPITIDPVTGQYIGDDGFRVPQNFDEFYRRYPNYIRNWVAARLGHGATAEDVENCTQDLILRMKSTPTSSTYHHPNVEDNPAARRDAIEAFDPHENHGASEFRWEHYVNAWLSDTFDALLAKQQSQAGGARLEGRKLRND